MTLEDRPYDIAAWTAVLRGLDRLAEAVAATYGPRGRRLVLADGAGAPTVSDAVMAPKVPEFGDLFEDLGADMLMSVTSKTADVGGGGTATTVLLARAILSEARAALAAGENVN